MNQRFAHFIAPTFFLDRDYLINGTSDLFVQAYHDYQVDLAVMFGAERSQAKKKMKEALEFELELAKVNFLMILKLKFVYFPIKLQISIPRDEMRTSESLFFESSIEYL